MENAYSQTTMGAAATRTRGYYPDADLPLHQVGSTYTLFRIFSPRFAFKWAIITGYVVVTLAYLAMMFVVIFGNTRAILLPASDAIACINLITDVYLLVLPISAASLLNLPLSRKIGVVTVFAAGLL
jgi:hypothetical protein